MTYSIEIINDYNEFVLDDYPVMHEVDSGQAWFSTSGTNLAFGVLGNFFWVPYYNPSYACAKAGYVAGGTGANPDRVNRLTRWAAPSATSVSWSKQSLQNDLLPDFVTTLKGDLSFFEMPPDGIVNALNYYADTSHIPNLSGPIKGAGIVIPNLDDTYTPNYVSVSTSILNTTPTGTHGLLVNDPSGNKILDSRLDLISLVDYTVFSASTIESVLKTGTPVTFTPRTSITTPMVAMTKNVSMYSVANSKNWHHPLVTWDGTKFTMSRITLSGNENLFASVFQGFGMFVAESTA